MKRVLRLLASLAVAYMFGGQVVEDLQRDVVRFHRAVRAVVLAR